MELGTIFTEEQYDEAYEYISANGYTIEELEPKDGVRQFKIVEIPQPLPPTYEEVQQARASAYEAEVDPLMSQYNRKKTFNLFEGNEEAELLAKIEAKVAEIKEANPYPA